MTHFIQFEYLLACAMITMDARTVSMKDLNEYRGFLQKQFDDSGIDAMFLFSSKYAEEAVRNYPELFQFGDEYCTTVSRKDGVADEDLISKLLSYLSVAVLQAVHTVGMAHYETYASKH